jgi:glycosyltransferase involved in cell wall biosynthesis
MLIGIDANEANLTTNRVGINQYAFNLLWALSEIKTPHKFIVYLKNEPLADLPRMNYRVIPFPKLWTQTRLPLDLFTHIPHPDVFFSMTHYAPRWAPMPTVVSIMDLGFLKTPEQFTTKDYNQLKNWTNYSVRNAKKVIAISEFTKKDVMTVYGKSDQDVMVTPLSYDKKLFKPTKDVKVLKKYGINHDYFLFLSSLKPSKNVEGLIRAYHQGRFTEKLVIVGKKAWLFEAIFNLVKELGLTDKVIFTGFVDEAEVPVLTSGAKAFVLPSFYEGFGIPVLEAMACGVPVVLSDIASLPEVAGEAGIYVNPHSIDSIIKGMQVAVGKDRSEFVQKGLKIVELFDWAKTAQLTLQCLQTATEKN